MDEAARQLGDVSPRTVRRMVDRGELPTVKVGRLVRIPADAVRGWVENNMRPAHNPECVGQDVQRRSTCQENAKPETKMVSTNGKTHRTGGYRSPTRAAAELAKVLELPTGAKPKHS
jgi:excisionase family DNA binding protein